MLRDGTPPSDYVFFWDNGGQLEIERQMPENQKRIILEADNYWEHTLRYGMGSQFGPICSIR